MKILICNVYHHQIRFAAVFLKVKGRSTRNGHIFLLGNLESIRITRIFNFKYVDILNFI